MVIYKKIADDQLFLYMNGALIYKRWLKTGQSKVFDIMAYDKYTLASYRAIKDESTGLFMVRRVQPFGKRKDL